MQNDQIEGVLATANNIDCERTISHSETLVYFPFFMHFFNRNFKALRFLRQQAAFSILKKGDFDRALNLFQECEVDPRELLSLYKDDDLMMAEEFHPNSDLQGQFDTNSNLPPLPSVRDYLESLQNAEWANGYRIVGFNFHFQISLF
jgi:hypothetical protein